jgi:hypothetical protein
MSVLKNLSHSSGFAAQPFPFRGPSFRVAVDVARAEVHGAVVVVVVVGPLVVGVDRYVAACAEDGFVGYADGPASAVGLVCGAVAAFGGAAPGCVSCCLTSGSAWWAGAGCGGCAAVQTRAVH